jgi:hypothetical protein
MVEGYLIDPLLQTSSGDKSSRHSSAARCAGTGDGAQSHDHVSGACVPLRLTQRR